MRWAPWLGDAFESGNELHRKFGQYVKNDIGNSDNMSKMTSVGSERTECDTVSSKRERATSSLVLRVRECDWSALLCRPDNFFLLNPTTHEYAWTPDAPASNPILAYGFGYASSINDFKLVFLIKHEPLVAMFSMRTGLWNGWGLSILLHCASCGWG